MAQTIVDGLIALHNALAVLAADTQLLDHARRRFSHSPPPAPSSNQSSDSTLTHVSHSPTEEEKLRTARRFVLINERGASLPYTQFIVQSQEEHERLLKGLSDRTLDYQADTDVWNLAKKNVIKSWQEQGIWNDCWSERHNGRWKHEKPLELNPELETEPQQQVVRRREASRPFHQFVYQVSKERDRIQDERGSKEADMLTSPDVNTRAYENVKKTWFKRGIWNRKWGILPGMSWKHEEPLDAEELPVTIINQIPSKTVSGEPVTDMSKSHVSMKTPSTRNSPPESNSPPSGHGRPALRPIAGHTLRSGRRESSHGHGPAHLVASTSHGPAHSSKVSKAPTKRRPGPQRRPKVTEMVSLPEQDTAEPPLQAAGTPQRRSKRFHLKETRTANDFARIASADPLKDVSRPRLKRIAGENTIPVGTVKPQGISKTRYSLRRRRRV